MTLHDMNILVTGGTGSFGKAFARYALDNGVRRLVIFARDEAKRSVMEREFPDPRMRFFTGDVRDRGRLRLAMDGVDIVIHAAAMKRIETCEADPSEAVATNVIGSQNVALAAIQAGVQKALLLSTDKAPVAHTLYGATKFCAERLWNASNVYAAGGPTRLAATRYGNVLGSRGSVLDLWRQQYAARQPLTLTDERCTRFWMTMDDALYLVLDALDEMQGGEVFIPAIGSAPLLRLAQAFAERDGKVYEPGHVCAGLRPGERLHETLITSDEARHAYGAELHYVIEPEVRLWVSKSEAGPGAPLPEGFTYRSDSNPEQLSVDELREMIAPNL